MTSPMPIDSSSQAHPVFNPSASNATTAGAAAMSNTAVTGSTKIKSMADFKNKAPKVYKMMMDSIQEMMRRDMQHHQERLKKAIKGND